MGIHIEAAIAQRFSESFREHLMKTGVLDLLQVAITAPTDELKFTVISKELELSYDAMISSMVVLMRECGDATSDHSTRKRCSDSKRGELRDDVIDRALDTVYYWHVLNPLTRGSAMLGYMSIMATALAIGVDIHLPQSDADLRSMQMDLEAIFADDRHAFRTVMREVFQSRSATSVPQHWFSEAAHTNGDGGAILDLDDVFSTRRRMVSFLNFDETVNSRI
jgi:hypothetical protein